MKLKCNPLSPKLGREVPYPYYASSGAAAMDIHACLDDDVTIQPGQRVMIPTGLAIALPDAGYVALIFARSGLGVKHGIVPANCVGVIDADYTGELLVSLQNTFDTPYTVRHGDRIAQLVLTPIFTPPIQEVEELAATGRGEGRFGSTGKR